MAKAAASKKTKEDVVPVGKKVPSAAVKAETGTSPVLKNDEETPGKNNSPADKATPKDGTLPDTPDGKNTGGGMADSENTDGKETADGEEEGKNETVNTPADKDNARKTGDLPFTVKDGMVEVVSVKRAGKSVYATTGNLITFDKNGKANVLLADALHFLNVPGFEFT